MIESPESLQNMLGLESMAGPRVAGALDPAVERGRQAFIALADASPAMIWMTGPDGLCTYVNSAWLDFRGRKLEQETGSGWAEGIHPEDGSHCLREYVAAIANVRPFHLRYRIQYAGGNYCSVENTGQPWILEGGALAGYVGQVAAISLQEEQKREAARLLACLSVRERQILGLIARGYGTKEAATRLGISYKTADSHRSHVLKKLGLHETASVVRFAIRSGLIAERPELAAITATAGASKL